MPTTGAPSLIGAWSVEEVREVHQGRHDALCQAQQAQSEHDGGEEQDAREQVPRVRPGQDASKDAEDDA